MTEADRATTHYPYDPRQAEQLMTEAGFRKGANGLHTDWNIHEWELR